MSASSGWAETYLNLFEYPIDAVLVNRLLAPDQAADGYLEGLLARQQRILAEIRSTFASLPILEAPLATEEPVGLDALSRLARQLFGERDPTAVLHVGPTQTIDRQGRGYVLRIPMPHVEVHKLELTKHGDQLYVDVGNFRREVSLPLTLATLEPGVARVRSGMLEILPGRLRRGGALRPLRSRAGVSSARAAGGAGWPSRRGL